MTTGVTRASDGNQVLCHPSQDGSPPQTAACSWTLNVEDTVCETCIPAFNNGDYTSSAVWCLPVPPVNATTGRASYWSMDQQKRSVGHPAAAPGRAERED